VYVPGLRFMVRAFVPPWNVGVAPTTGPLLPCSIVTLCIRGAIFVKSIVTFPAFAISELFVNFNCPPGSAASESEPLPATGAGADPVVVDAAGVLGEDGALLLLPLLPLLLLLELPQAARLSATAATLSAAGNLDKTVSSRAVDGTAAASVL
jgi:hypothetical protein